MAREINLIDRRVPRVPMIYLCSTVDATCIEIKTKMAEPDINELLRPPS